MTAATTPDRDHDHREQVILNRVFNDDIDSLNADSAPTALKITESGTTTYVAISFPGTPVSSPLWQVKKIDESSGTVITWADGDANFDNVATDLTALSYR